MIQATKNFETGIEKQLREALESRGFQHGVDFSTQYPLRYGYILDIAFPVEKLAVEADGAAWHGSKKARKRDHIKDNVLAKIGWTVLRFSDRQIIEDCAGCVDEIEKMLRIKRVGIEH
jgi:very-short-patch-repair endonuclease